MDKHNASSKLLRVRNSDLPHAVQFFQIWQRREMSSSTKTFEYYKEFCEDVQSLLCSKGEHHTNCNTIRQDKHCWTHLLCSAAVVGKSSIILCTRYNVWLPGRTVVLAASYHMLCNTQHLDNPELTLTPEAQPLQAKSGP